MFTFTYLNQLMFGIVFLTVIIDEYDILHLLFQTNNIFGSLYNKVIRESTTFITDKYTLLHINYIQSYGVNRAVINKNILMMHKIIVTEIHRKYSYRKHNRLFKYSQIYLSNNRRREIEKVFDTIDQNFPKSPSY